MKRIKHLFFCLLILLYAKTTNTTTLPENTCYINNDFKKYQGKQQLYLLKKIFKKCVTIVGDLYLIDLEKSDLSFLKKVFKKYQKKVT